MIFGGVVGIGATAGALRMAVGTDPAPASTDFPDFDYTNPDQGNSKTTPEGIIKMTPDEAKTTQKFLREKDTGAETVDPTNYNIMESYERLRSYGIGKLHPGVEEAVEGPTGTLESYFTYGLTRNPLYDGTFSDEDAFKGEINTHFAKVEVGEEELDEDYVNVAKQRFPGRENGAYDEGMLRWMSQKYFGNNECVFMTPQTNFSIGPYIRLTLIGVAPVLIGIARK